MHGKPGLRVYWSVRCSSYDHERDDTTSSPSLIVGDVLLCETAHPSPQATVGVLEQPPMTEESDGNGKAIMQEANPQGTRIKMGPACGKPWRW